MHVDRAIAYCREKAAEFRALAKEYVAANRHAMAAPLEEIARDLDDRAAALQHPPAPSGTGFPAQYRSYFLDGDRRIVGLDDFVAANDMAALAVAERLSDICSDRCAGIELWQGVRQVEPGDCQRRLATPEAIAAAVQEIAIERELAIRNSTWAIANSVRLLDETSRLIERQRGG